MKTRRGEAKQGSLNSQASGALVSVGLVFALFLFPFCCCLAGNFGRDGSMRVSWFIYCA